MRKPKPKSLPTPRPPEVVCKFAFHTKVEESWCNKTRHQAACEGCERNVGNDVSTWQEKRAADKKGPDGFEPVGDIDARVIVRISV